MAVDTLIKQLLEAGVHFGHQTNRWNPKMKQFIFGERSGTYIIDLQQTAQRLKAAQDYLKDNAAKGRNVLFVGTKKQAQEIIVSEAARCRMFYVSERWLGGTLTNFHTIRKSVERLRDLEALTAPESTASLSKKEKSSLDKEIGRLRTKLSGIIQMQNLPGALILVDPKKEEIALHEANKLSIPVVALLDTNCDPEGVDFPVPGNDDAVRSIKLVVSLLADSVLEGRKRYVEAKEPPEKPEKKPEEKTAEAEIIVRAPSNKEEELITEQAEKKFKEPEEPLKRKPKAQEGRRPGR